MPSDRCVIGTRLGRRQLHPRPPMTPPTTAMAAARYPERDRWVVLGVLLLVVALMVGLAPAPALADHPGAGGTHGTARDDVEFGRSDVQFGGSDTQVGRSDVQVVRYDLPVDGGVLRPFEAPTTLFGPGHRGVDLEAPVGGTIRAAASGRVTFVGPVAGTTWISIAHHDGIVTSYGPIAEPTVRPGEQVERGERIGALAAGGHGHGAGDAGLHWGARRDHRYLDPLTLLGRGIPRPSLVGDGGWRATDHAVEPYAPWGGARAGGWLYHGSPTATRPGFAVPPNGNHLVMVAGLGSSSATVPVEPEHLGYRASDVTLLSYAGRADRGAMAASDPRRDQLTYGPEETWDGVEQAALRLRDQLRAQRLREPGRAVDLVGYSLGGVVIVHYLANHHDAYDPTLPAIGHVVTVGSPLQGSDVAALVTDVRSHRVYGRGLDALYEHLGGPDGSLGRHVHGMPLDAPVLDDLDVGSPLVTRIADGVAGAVGEVERGPLAMGTRLLTIGGGTDVIVSPDRARLPVDPIPEGPAGDALIEHRVLPGDHAAVRQTEAAREVIWRFLADEDVVASPGYLSMGAARVGGHVARHLGDGLERSDRWSAPFVPPLGGP